MVEIQTTITYTSKYLMIVKAYPPLVCMFRTEVNIMKQLIYYPYVLSGWVGGWVIITLSFFLDWVLIAV